MSPYTCKHVTRFLVAVTVSWMVGIGVHLDRFLPEPERGDRSYTHTDLGTGAEVTPLTGVMIDGLTAQIPGRDWSLCSMTQADDTLIIWCPDGYRMES